MKTFLIVVGLLLIHLVFKFVADIVLFLLFKIAENRDKKLLLIDIIFNNDDDFYEVDLSNIFIIFKYLINYIIPYLVIFICLILIIFRKYGIIKAIEKILYSEIKINKK